MKKLADSLTGLRFVLATLIVWAVWTSDPETGAGTVVVLLLLAWTSDFLDGPLARRAAVAQQTWLGAHDLEADTSLALALGFCMAIWHGVPITLLVIILFAAALGRVVFHSLAPVKLGIGIIYGMFILMVWRIEPLLGAAIVAWIGAAALLNLPRSRAQVSGFLRECRRIAQEHSVSRKNGTR